MAAGGLGDAVAARCFDGRSAGPGLGGTGGVVPYPGQRRYPGDGNPGPEPQLSLQPPRRGDVALPEQADDDAVSSGAPGATGAVHVVGSVGRRVEVDHERYGVDV